MKSTIWKRLSGAILVFLAVGGTICSALQFRILDGDADGVARRLVWNIGMVTVPVLVILAYRKWARNARHEVSRWRNVLGLTSLVIISFAWLFTAIFLPLGFFWPDLTMPHAIELDADLFYFNLLATLLAIALKGVPRAQVISAAWLMLALSQTHKYFNLSL